MNRTFQRNKLDTGRKKPVQYALDIGIFANGLKEKKKDLFEKYCGKKNRCNVDIGPIYTYR